MYLQCIRLAFFSSDFQSRALFTCKSPETLQTLVKEGAKLDGKRGDGATPLIVHTELGNFEVVKVLIELNANVDLQDEVRRFVCESRAHK